MHRWVHIALAAALVVAYAAFLYASGFTPAAEGRLADGDAYMWLMRVTDLHASGDWYSQWQVQTNAPHGETLHWTRPFDVVLLLGGLAGALVTDFPTALWGWGMIVSPVLLLAAIPLWSWATRPVLTGGEFVLSVALIFLLWRIGLAFAPGRPDHHGFLGLLFIAVFACVLRLAVGGGGRGVAWVGGAVAGLGLWASIEALIALVAAAGVLATFWIAGWHRRAGLLARFLAATAAVVLFGLAVQRPPAEWLTERYAQLAAPHGWLMIWAALAWGGLTWAEARSTHDWSWPRRLAAAAMAGAAVVVAMALVYPTFFAGPWVDYDVARVKEWLPTIGEFNSLMPTNSRRAFNFAIEAGPVLIALIWCAFAWRDTTRRRLVLPLALGMAIYLPLGLNQGRWLYYAQILALAPWALAITDAMARAGAISALGPRALARTGALLVLVLGPVFAGGAVRAVLPVAAEPVAASCDWVGMARHLKANTATRHSIVMTHSFKGPELAWFGDVRVVTASYGHDSLWEGWRFFRATEDAPSREVAQARQLDYVLVCERDREGLVLGGADPASLYSRLAAGTPPDWLEPITLPAALGEFRLYRPRR